MSAPPTVSAGDGARMVSLVVAGVLVLTVPLWAGSYVTGILVFVEIYAIVAIGINLLMGQAGQVSFGHNAFFGLGGYTSAILSFRYGVSPWLGVVCGLGLTAVVSYLIAKPILRFRGHMLGIVTLAIGVIFWGLFGEMDFLTGGYEGFSRIPRFSIAGFTFSEDRDCYYLFLVILALHFAVAANIVRSRVGKQLKTLDVGSGGSEVAAEMLGVDIAKVKTQVFVISAAYASVAGSLYVHYVTHVDPGPFSLWTAFLLIVMVVIGGARSLWGALVGPAFYFGLKELISYAMPAVQAAALAKYEIMIFSLLFIGTLVLFPEGLVRLPAVLAGRRR